MRLWYHDRSGRDTITDTIAAKFKLKPSFSGKRLAASATCQLRIVALPAQPITLDALTTDLGHGAFASLRHGPLTMECAEHYRDL